MFRFPRRLAAVPLLALSSLLLAWRPAHPQTITLDGQLDPGQYTLIAQDPPGDLIPSLSASSLSAWAELSALYVTTDTTNLYVYVALPAYNFSASSGEIGLTIDTTGDLPNSGGAADPWGNAITYAYTSTLNNASATPQPSTNTILPDVIIRGRLLAHDGSGTELNDGWTELRTWNDTDWDGAAVDWGGISAPLSTQHIAYASGQGVEFSIPFADLGVPATAILNLEFYATHHVGVEGPNGALDTVPSDDQSTADHDPTTQQHLATWGPDLVSPPPLELFIPVLFR